MARSARRRSLLGVYGLFGFHFLLFVALRTAPPLEANLVNYLWPLLIVVLAPVFLPGIALRPVHVGRGARRLRRRGAGDRRRARLSGGFAWGYLAAAGSAFIWASYSLLTRRVAHFPTAAIGLFGLVSGLLALACHALLEPAVALSARDVLLIARHRPRPARRRVLSLGRGAEARRSAPRSASSAT